MSKRSNGSGAIYRRKDGRWVASVIKPKFLGGGRFYHYAKKRRECEDWLTEKIKKLKDGSFTVNSSITLLEWLNLWLKDYCPNLKDSTRMSYECYINKHIVRHSIAKMPLYQVSTHAIQGYINFLMSNEGRLDGKGGLSPKSVTNQIRMLHAALHQAKGNRLISDNPADYIVLPHVEKHKVNILDIDAQDKLIAAANGERWQIGIQLSLGTGLRIGELLALRITDLKYDEGIFFLDISKSLQRVKNFSNPDSSKTVLHESSTKTVNSNRKIVLSPNLTRLINDHISMLQQEAENAYGLYNNNAYLISNEIGEKVDPTTYRKWFNEVVKSSGLTGRITPHVCRHSFASTALRYGMDLKTISDTLGHYSTDFTARTYVSTDIMGRYEKMCSLEQTINNKRSNENEHN